MPKIIKTLKNIFLTIGIIATLGFILYLGYYLYMKYSKDYIEVNIKGTIFQLEIADTKEKRETGLMNRRSMPPNRGMLFVFETSGYYPFWMKNTYIPLDIIWLNEDKEVIYIKQDAKPCLDTNKDPGMIGKALQNIPFVCDTIIPLTTSHAKYVIELNAGKVRELNLQNDEKVEFEYTNSQTN